MLVEDCYIANFLLKVAENGCVMGCAVAICDRLTPSPIVAKRALKGDLIAQRGNDGSLLSSRTLGCG